MVDNSIHTGESQADYGRRLMDEINREIAEKAGISAVFLWSKIKEGIEEEEGSVRYNYIKLSGEWIGLKPVERIQHSGSVGIIPQLSDGDRAVLAASIKQEMPTLIEAANSESEED